MIKECVPLTGITAVCKEMFCFRSQLQMVKSCFCLCLNSTLGFHILCFPFHIWLFACCLCSPNVFRCAEVAFLPQIAAWALAVVINAWPQQPLAVSRWCSTAATTSNLIKQGSLPEQGVLQRPVLAVHNHGNGNIDVTLGCVFSLSAHPLHARGREALRSKQA